MGAHICVLIVPVLLLLAFLWAWKNLYKKPSADEAFVRTGMGGVKVFKDQAGLVIGLFHHMKWISLEILRITIERVSPRSLRDADGVEVDFVFDIALQVNPDENSILQAARSLGEKALSEDSVRFVLEAHLVTAAREVIASRPIEEARRIPDALEQEIRNQVAPHLANAGMRVVACTIGVLRRSDAE
ncbi:MAG: SPFH domain-containing protein [Planctomycetota bacterium]|jgi:uncharacterized membrane protein YqiK